MPNNFGATVNIEGIMNKYKVSRGYHSIVSAVVLAANEDDALLKFDELDTCELVEYCPGYTDYLEVEIEENQN